MKMKLSDLKKWSPGYLQQLEPEFFKWLTSIKPALYTELLKFENRLDLTDDDAKTADDLAETVNELYQQFKIGEIVPDPEAVTVTPATRGVMNNSKVMAILPKVSAMEGTTRVNCNVGTKSKEILVPMRLATTDKLLPANITPYDKAVFDGVCTLFEAGNAVFTPDMVYRAMNGKKGSTRVSPAARQKVSDSLEKQMMTLITIDFYNQAEAYGMTKPDDKRSKFVIKGNMLYLQKASVVINGVETESAFKLIKPPALLSYAKTFNHVLYVPISTFDMGNALKGSDDITVMTRYIAQQLVIMRGGHIQKRMTYDTIFENCGVNYKVPQHMARGRGYVKTILGEFAKKPIDENDPNGKTFLKSFKEYKKGNKIIGVEITL